MTALLAFTGCLSLVITGELAPVFLIPGIALLPGYYRFLRGYQPAPRWVISLLSIVAVGLLAFDVKFASGDFFVAVAHMSIVFQALKSFDLRDPWDHLQVYFMSLLQLVMTSELAISMAVGGMFIVFLFMMMAAIVLSHFLKEGTLGKVGLKRPVAIISLTAFALTLLFFVALPRAQGSFWSGKAAKGVRTVGFSEKVDFGSFGGALEDPTVVMRAEISGSLLPLYWRGVTLDYFDGTSWENTLGLKSRVYKSGGRFDLRYGAHENPESLQKIYLEPLDTEVVFGLGVIEVVEAPGRWLLSRDLGGSVYMPGKAEKRITYTVHSVPDGEMEVSMRYKNRYLQLPESINRKRIHDLAREVTKEAVTDRQAAFFIDFFLKTGYSYSLETGPPAEGSTPIEHFLFNSKTGYCEHFSTAMVVMLRSLGIPSRIVTGFAGGETNPFGDYVVVRQRDAHSWVEAGIDGKWKRFDPTPPAQKGLTPTLSQFFDTVRMNWYRYVVGFNRQDQRAIVRSVTAPVITLPSLAGVEVSVKPVYLIALLAALALILTKLSLHGLPAPRPFEGRIYLMLRKAVTKRGGKVNASSTPEEVLREALRVGMDGEGARELVRIYEETRFGSKKLDQAARRRFKELCAFVIARKRTIH